MSSGGPPQRQWTLTGFDAPGFGIDTDIDGPQLRPGERVVVAPVAEIVEKLNEMRLHDDTCHPFDVGYMAAIAELRDWLGSSGRPPEEKR